MEYFLHVNGIKQGPFDMISMIKKVKNGTLVKNTMVSLNYDGPFIEADQVPEVALMIEEHTNPTASGSRHDNIRMTLKVSIQEGGELWVRRVLDYTLISGFIIGIGFGVQYLMRGIFPTGSIGPGYIASVFVMALFFEFCYYVLEIKRSQQIAWREFFSIIKRTLPAFFGISALLSLCVLFYGVSIPAGFIATFVMTLLLTVLIFTPFLATDSHMSVMRAAKLSMQKTLGMGADNFGVIFAIVSINLFAAILPALMLKELLGLGLFISVPVTVSAIAYIYDQIFA